MKKLKMEEHSPSMTQKEIEIYTRVGRLVTTKFDAKLHSDTIVEDVMNDLHPHEQNEEIKDVVRGIVFNRQLMKERFL
jgi:hypothetical protein